MEKSLQHSDNILPIEDEALDPRVQVELENLNVATNEINSLEAALEEANNSFRASLNETSSQLQALSKKLGACVEKARPYYEAKEKSKQLQIECQRAAVQYQRANAVHHAARETIALAEDRFANLKDASTERKFDAAWQEMLNHATMKVMEAEAQKSASEREHQRRAAAYTSAEKEVQELQRKLKTVINKSRPYFNHRAATQIKLEAQKDQIQKLQKDIVFAKNKYSFTLRSLERISEEIHELRRINMKREPGVGAEMNPSDTFVEKTPSQESILNAKVAEEQKYWDNLREKIHEFKDYKNEKVSNEDPTLLVFKDNLSIPYQELSSTSYDVTQVPCVRYDSISPFDSKIVDNPLLLANHRPFLHTFENVNRIEKNEIHNKVVCSKFAKFSEHADRVSLSDILIEEKEPGYSCVRTDPSGQADDLPIPSLEATLLESLPDMKKNSSLKQKMDAERNPIENSADKVVNVIQNTWRKEEIEKESTENYSLNENVCKEKMSVQDEEVFPKPNTVAEAVKIYESLSMTSTTMLDNGNVLTGYESDLL